MSEFSASLSNVSKRYGSRRGLLGVTLQIGAGQSVAVLGANGAGKSTLLKLIAGILRPSEGEVSVLGVNPRSARARIGYVGEAPQLYPFLTAYEYLTFFARLYGIRESDSDAALRKVSMADRRDVLVRELSRGEKQRVAIARAVQHDPDILVADEPFATLDAEATGLATAVLKGDGRTVIAATHDRRLAETFADSLVNLHEGRLA